MLLPHSNNIRYLSSRSLLTVVFVFFIFLYIPSGATENQLDSWSLEKLESCLSRCKFFQAEKYQSQEYSDLLEKSKVFLSLQPTHETYTSKAKDLQNSCISILLNSSSKYIQTNLSQLESQIQLAENTFSELLAKNAYVQSRQIYNESLLIQTELELKKKSFSKELVWNSDFESFLNESESLDKKIQKGLELAEKSIQLSLSQSEQLVSAVLDVERTLNYILTQDINQEMLSKISNYKSELAQALNKIQEGGIKEGYLKAEKIRIEIGEILLKLLSPKFARDYETLKERFEKLKKSFDEISSHPEDENFHSNYIHSKDTLNAIHETLRQAQELNSLERFGEAFELLEEGLQLASLLEEDLPSLKRNQSHILKQHSTGSKKENHHVWKPNSKNKNLSQTFIDDNKQRAGKSKSKTRVHITKIGDTLSSIAKRYYGKESHWKKIHKINNQIQNPDLIYPDQKILLPPY